MTALARRFMVGEGAGAAEDVAEKRRAVLRNRTVRSCGVTRKLPGTRAGTVDRNLRFP
jgi:hypothetical protein